MRNVKRKKDCSQYILKGVKSEMTVPPDSWRGVYSRMMTNLDQRKINGNPLKITV